jgi:hypothetical protein
MSTATDERAEASGHAEVSRDELAAEFPGWHIWRSRPIGLWWATRIGGIHYDSPHQFRTEWAMTIGDVRTLTELRAQLIEQRELDDPEPLPIDGEPPSVQPLRTGSARACGVRQRARRP